MYTYLWCFFIFAFLGWCCEVIYAAVIEKRFVNRGFLNGPLCPIYGFGVIIIDFCMGPAGQNPLALIVGSMVLGSALEWVTGFLLEKVFRQKWWDYSDMPHNLNGYICLSFSLIWGLAGMFVVGVLMPVSRSLIGLIPRTLGWALLAVFGALCLTDFIVTAVAIIGLNRKLKRLEFVSEKIRQGSEKLGQGLFEHTVALDEKRLKGESELLHEAAVLKEKYGAALHANPIHRRLLLAFPGLRSVKYNKELEALRQNVDGIRRRSSERRRRRSEAAVAFYEEKIPEGAEKPFAFGMCFSKLFWIFMIGSVIGWALETVFALIVPPHVFEMRVSLVFGPFIIVYGFGAVAMTLLLSGMYNQRDSLIFIASMVIGGGFEYVCSYIQQSLFGMVSWEYSDSVLNVGGRTNLMYSVFWGVLGLVWVKDAFPFLAKRIQNIPKKKGRIVTAVAAVIMVIDMAVSAGAVARRSERINEIPPQNAAQSFFDSVFPDSVMDFIYPHMQYVGRPEISDKYNIDLKQ